MTDIEKLRAALSDNSAKEALDRIEARLMPEMPEGWFLTNLYSNSGGYVCVLLPQQCVLNTGKRGVGKTAVEAINDAIREIDR